MTSDDLATAAFASWDSYTKFARRVKFSNRYILDEEDRDFLQTVLATNRGRDVILKEGTILYRAQKGVDVINQVDDEGNWIGEDTWAFGAKRMKPFADRAREGRANPTGIPVLYVGSTIKTAVSEVRPWVGAEISVAECRLLRPLRTIDLSKGHGKSALVGPIFNHLVNGTAPSAKEIENAVWTDIDNAFSQPVTQTDDRADYAPTQILAELFRNAGYDAIGYKSLFGDTEKRGGFNIAVFDPDAVEISSCAPFQVKSIEVVAEQSSSAWTKSTTNE